MMREIILASHGALAAGMADTARMIIGDDPHLSTLALLPGSHPDCLKRQIEERLAAGTADELSLIHISEPTRQAEISYAVFCLKKKKTKRRNPWRFRRKSYKER